MTGVMAVVAAVLCAAAGLTLVRLVRGPSMLDRVVATDVLIAVIVCGLAVTAAASGDSTTVPVLVVVSLLGFLGSVSVARLLGQDRP